MCGNAGACACFVVIRWGGVVSFLVGDGASFVVLRVYLKWGDG